MGKYIRFYWPHVAAWLERRETNCYTKSLDATNTLRYTGIGRPDGSKPKANGTTA
jgi:hypothetical protein